MADKNNIIFKSGPIANINTTDIIAGQLLFAIENNTGSIYLDKDGTNRIKLNADALKLVNARTINGTSFDGTSDITTTKWGTARNIIISDNSGTYTQTNSGIDGSSNFTLKLPASITATLKGNADTATKANTADSATTAASCTGNAATASKLKTGVAINGTIFDGTAAITTANWGTARTIIISDNSGTNTQSNSGINGSANFTLKLPATIKANLSGKATSAGTADSATTATTAGTCTGNAATATALTTSAGSAAQAIYFSGGKPVSIDWHIGNANVGEHNCNNITYNMIGYYTSNGPSTSLGATTSDGSIYSQAYSSSWVSQIAQDYSDGALFVRGKNNGTWTSWLAILDSSNYTSYTVTKTGTGASGTWGISISGTAAKATADGDGNTISSTYLKKSGGVMNGTAVISWPDTGNWSNNNSGVTFPVIRGGFQWYGQSDYVKLFAEETASDQLNLVCQFGNDANPALVFRNTSGTQVAKIGADGTMTATTFSGALSGNAATATKLQTARTIFGRSFNGTSNVEGQVDCYGSYTATASQRYHSCALEIRENGLVGSAQSDIGYAPSIGFHWGYRSAATLNYHSDGIFYFRKQDGVTRATIDANVNGWASSAGSATTATYLVEDESFNLSRHSFQYFNISGTAGAAVSVNDTPTTAWWHIQRHTHANSAGYYTDVAIPFNDNQIYYKRVVGGNLQNGGWVMLYDTKNIIYSSTEPTSGLKVGMIWLCPA